MCGTIPPSSLRGRGVVVTYLLYLVLELSYKILSKCDSKFGMFHFMDFVYSQELNNTIQYLTLHLWCIILYCIVLYCITDLR